MVSYNAFEALAVSSTAVGFTAATYLNRRSAFVQVQGNPVRYRIDGVADPTASVGIEAPVGAIIQLKTKDQMVKFRAIATGADAVCAAEFGY